MNKNKLCFKRYLLVFGINVLFSFLQAKHEISKVAVNFLPNNKKMFLHFKDKDLSLNENKN